MSHFPEFACQPVCFKQEKFREDLKTGSAVDVFKNAIAGVNTNLEQRFYENEDIYSLVRERSAFIDLLLHYAWHQYLWENDIALVAVGGYGRGELHPYSDIDIMLLLADDAGAKYNEQIQQLIAFFWDIGLEIGCSVRSVSECTQIAADDITVATNIMESRTLAGNTHLLETLSENTSLNANVWPIKDFFQAKWHEQQERHRRFNDTESNLEPNVKNSPGGLRDIQMVNWVAKRYFKVHTLAQLEGTGFFSENEFAALRSGEEFLWKVRYGIHLLTSRADDRLLFEHQRELAKQFGYCDSDKRLAVEQFMHKYYRTAQVIRELNDVLLNDLREAIFSDANTKANITPINERFQLRNGFIEVTRDTIFDEHPSALLEIFVLMGNDSSIDGVRASTIRLIRDKRWLVDDAFRANPENKRMFMAIFSIQYGLITQLTRMKRYGILGRYLPAFGQITGQMQHDLFHRYTVDAHTLLVIQNMRRFTLPEEGKDFPIATHVMRNLPKPELLYIAGLFHDIGKGRGGDHSVLGAQDALEFCEAHDLSGREARLVAWLVEKHLLMSYVSQKQDISDPEVIHNFALQMGDQLHLDYLYALTVADMCGTNPEIWNSWRASLMRQLYTETKRSLRKGLENTVDLQEMIEEKQAQALIKLEDKNISHEAALRLWETMGDEYFIRENHWDIAWQTEALLKHNNPKEPLVLIRETQNQLFRDATEIFVSVPDAAHVFVAVATSLSQQNLMIQDARIYSSASGITIDTFYVLDENHQPLSDQTHRYEEILSSLRDELSLIGEYSKVAARRTPRQLKQFPIPTRTYISNDLSRNCTVLEVISPDRAGLLATIAHIFMRHGIQMQNAKISTLGERVEDVFFITDEEGNPLSEANHCKALQDEICHVLDQRVEREQ